MEETAQKSSSYGKRPLWQWVLLYLVIGVIVYGLVYYFVLAKKGSSMYGQQGQSQVQVSPAPTSETQASPSATNEQNAITLTQNGFSPATITIKAGTKVTWTNKSGIDATVNSDPHPTHTDYPPLNLGKFSDGGTHSLTFDKPGTYGYHNHFNASERGTIIVQ